MKRKIFFDFAIKTLPLTQIFLINRSSKNFVNVEIKWSDGKDLQPYPTTASCGFTMNHIFGTLL